MNKRTFIAATTLAISIIAPMQTEAANTYTVQSGDTLSKIATKYSISVTQLKEWNQLSRDQIYVGQQLIVSKATEMKKGAQPLTWFCLCSYQDFWLLQSDLR